MLVAENLAQTDQDQAAREKTDQEQVDNEFAKAHGFLLDEEVSHDEVTFQNLGWQLKPWVWAAMHQRQGELERQTEQLASLLSQAGVKVHVENDVKAISAITGLEVPLTSWRPIRFLPAVAVRERKPMMNAMRFWLEGVVKNPQHIRYAVVSAGDLVPAHGALRETMEYLARRISKFAYKAKKKYKVTVQFRGTEFTRKTAGERADSPQLLEKFVSDTPLYHVHSNMLLQPMGFLGEAKWAEFLSFTHEFFGSHWKDCGTVKDVREIVKYVVKPGDLLNGERPLDASEAKWLHESLFGLKLAQPMGDFRAFYSGLRKEKKKVVSVRINRKLLTSVGELAIVSKGRKLDHSKKDDDVSEEAAAAALEQKIGDMNEAGSHPLDQGQDIGKIKRKAENKYLGRTLPQWHVTPWAEPLLLIQNYNPDTFGVDAHERLMEIERARFEARQVWDASGAPDPATALTIAAIWADSRGFNVAPLSGRVRAPYKVHTCRTTVPEERGGGRATDFSPESINEGVGPQTGKRSRPKLVYSSETTSNLLKYPPPTQEESEKLCVSALQLARLTVGVCKEELRKHTAATAMKVALDRLDTRAIQRGKRLVAPDAKAVFDLLGDHESSRYVTALREGILANYPDMTEAQIIIAELEGVSLR